MLCRSAYFLSFPLLALSKCNFGTLKLALCTLDFRAQYGYGPKAARHMQASYFLIHAPARVATIFAVYNITYVILFQFTPPAWVATSADDIQTIDLAISIHAARMGGDPVLTWYAI